MSETPEESERDSRHKQNRVKKQKHCERNDDFMEFTGEQHGLNI